MTSMKIDDSSGVKSNMSRGYLQGKGQAYRYNCYQNIVRTCRIYKCLQMNLETINGGNDLQYL